MTEGLPRPVSTEPERLALSAALRYIERNTPQLVRDEISTLVSERDALAVRVRELEGALREVEVFMSDLLRESLEAEGFTGQQLDRMVVMAKAPHITKPDSPLGKVIAALTTTSGDSHE